MYEEYILTTSIFPLVYLDHLYCDYSIFHKPGKEDHFTIDIHFQLDYLNGIYTEEVDLLKFKRNNDLSSLYPIFKIPYHIELKVSNTETTSLVQLIYIATSPNPEIFLCMYN